MWKNEHELLLVTNRGLMFGSQPAASPAAADRASFRLMCNEALRINTSELPHVAFRADGALLAATSNGLFLTRDEGCSWNPVPPLIDMFVPALVQLPGAPSTLVAATFGPGQSALRITRDGGASWSTLSNLSDRDYTRSMLVGPGDPALLYTTGTAFDDPPNPRETQYIARSSDAGQTWQRHTVTLQEGELGLLLLAINPVNGDELLVRAMSASPGFVSERLLLTRDGGRNFSTVHTLLGFEAGSFAPDGSAAWVASREGIFRAGAEHTAFVRMGVADYATCIEFHGDKLWTCGHYAGNDPARDGVGIAQPASSEFESFMDFREVSQPPACAPSTPLAGICNGPWRDFHDEVVRPFESPTDAGSAVAAIDDDASAPSASDDASAPTMPDPISAGSGDAKPAPRGPSSRCSASAPRTQNRSWSSWLILGALALYTRRGARR